MVKKKKHDNISFSKKWTLSFADEMSVKKDSFLSGLSHKKTLTVERSNPYTSDFSWKIVPFYLILAVIFTSILL